MDLHTSYNLLNLSYVLTVALCGASMLLDQVWIGGVGVLLFIGGIVQARIFYKCPKCGKNLPLHSGRPDRCPHCGSLLSQ